MSTVSDGAVAILAAAIDDACMALDDDLDLDANVDYGKRDGYFVRLDVEIGADSRYPERSGPTVGVAGYLALSADRAQILGALLVQRAGEVRQANEELREQRREG